MANDFELILNIDELIGIDCYLPIIHKIKEDSGIVIIKLDGESEKIYIHYSLQVKNWARKNQLDWIPQI